MYAIIIIKDAIFVTDNLKSLMLGVIIVTDSICYKCMSLITAHQEVIKLEADTWTFGLWEVG